MTAQRMDTYGKAGTLWDTGALLRDFTKSGSAFCIWQSIFIHSPTPINLSQNLLYNIYKGIYWCIQSIASHWSSRLDCSPWAFDKRFKRSCINNIGICQREKDRLCREDVKRQDTTDGFRTRQCQWCCEELGESMRASTFSLIRFIHWKVITLEAVAPGFPLNLLQECINYTWQSFVKLISKTRFCLHFCLFLVSRKR